MPAGLPPSSDPGNWIAQLPEDCEEMATDISGAQSDGPIPNAQAQSWWQQSLADFNQACSSIATASDDEQTALQAGTSGSSLSTLIVGGQAASELEAAVQLLQRVGTYITTKR